MGRSLGSTGGLRGLVCVTWPRASHVLVPMDAPSSGRRARLKEPGGDRKDMELSRGGTEGWMQPLCCEERLRDSGLFRLEKRSFG